MAKAIPVLVLACLISARAGAQPDATGVERASLSIEQTAAQGCIDGAALQSAVEDRIGAPVFGEPEAGRLHVSITVARAGTRLRAAVDTAQGDAKGTRTVEAKRCAALQDALGLVVALTLAAAERPAAPVAEPSAPSPSSDGQGNAAPPDSPQTTDAEPTPAAPGPAPPEAADVPANAARDRLDGILTAGFRDGPTPPAPIVGLAARWLPVGLWPQQLEIAASPPTSVDRNGVQARVDGLSARLLSCPLATTTLGLCAGTQLALLRVRGDAGSAVRGPGTGLAVSGLLQGQGDLPISGPLSLHGEATVGLTTIRPRFSFVTALGEQLPTFTVDSVLWDIRIGLAVAIL